MSTAPAPEQSTEDAPPRRFNRLAVAAAAIVGFLVGSTGLAMAGALPDPAQNAAHDVLAVVQVDVPEGRKDNHGACISEAAKLEDPAAKAAAKEACGSGKDHAPGQNGDRGKSADAPGKDKAADGTRASGKSLGKHADDPCKGKPPWAGNDDVEEGDRVRPADCPPDDADDDDGLEDDTDAG